MSFRSVVVGVSGGVDSAVTALLLKQKGFRVRGVFMKNWDLSEETGCSVSQDADDAKFVCDNLSIPFHEVNFVKQYWNNVFLYLVNAYETGLTPNPDIVCNRTIKFDLFFKFATEMLGADAVATGHYANTSFGNYLEKYDGSGLVKLLKAKDNFKDQTFFLSQIPQAALRRTMFPLGEYTKDLVKRIALRNGLERIVRKKESTGICFIGLRNFQNFVSEYVQSKPGKLINIENGEVVGTHNGLHLWTLGQGCRIGGGRQPFFIAVKDTESNDILVAPGTNHPCLFTDMMYTSKPYWIASTPFKDTEIFKCKFRFQHTKPLIQCQVMSLKSGGLIVVLERPLRAITPGQYAVFYSGDECLGSAAITQPGPSYFALGKDLEKDYVEYNVS